MFSIDYLIREKPRKRFIPWPWSWNIAPERGKGRYNWEHLGVYDPVEDKARVFLIAIWSEPDGEQHYSDLDRFVDEVIYIDVHETLHHALRTGWAVLLTKEQEHAAIEGVLRAGLRTSGSENVRPVNYTGEADKILGGGTS